MFYQRLFAALAKHDVRYLLLDGLAVNLHGIPRMTMDVDIIIALDPRNVDHFIAAADGELCATSTALRSLSHPSRI